MENTELSIIKCWFDGCCEPINPGGTASYGAVVSINGKQIWKDSYIFIPEKSKKQETSNNVAEYSGFKAILEYLLKNNLNHQYIEIFGDSNLVIQQMSGYWKIKQGFYVSIAFECKKLVKQFSNLKLTWIPREQNNIADKISKEILLNAGIEFRIQKDLRG